LAKQIDKSVGWLSQVKRDISQLFVDTLCTLAAALDVWISVFLDKANLPPIRLVLWCPLRILVFKIGRSRLEEFVKFDNKPKSFNGKAAFLNEKHEVSKKRPVTLRVDARA